MSPRTKQQFEKIRKTRKDKILTVALELFAQNGYQGTSIAQIAKKAKISKGLMYNYFKNKEKLLEEIVLEGFNKIMELDYGLSKSDKPTDKLKSLIDETLNNLSNNLHYWQLYTVLLVQPRVQKKFEKKFYQFREFFITTMTEIFKGLGSNNPELHSFLLGTHFDGLALNFIATPDDFPIEEIKQALYEQYCKPKRKKKK
ncbi:MAG: TetR/AcrR family transcriptional regulator [Bacteroidetes bacterium]|nr:TetR/AcrR family transcriptional regulator [Bacteroidota bacterium]MCH8034117.1 TetR/AcrR family transcriptional regulator [Bacteroidota bacterium]